MSFYRSSKNSRPAAQKWAAHIPAPTYAIDDQSAVAVVDGAVQVISEGQWHLFQPTPSQ